MASKLFQALCLIAGADRDIAEQCNDRDRQLIGSEAAWIVLIAILAWTAWWIALRTLDMPALEAAMVAVIVACFIFMFDRAMAASDWRLVGVLAQPMSLRERIPHGLVIAGRVIVSFILAQTTALGVTLWLFEGRIEQGLREDRNAANAPLMREFEADVEAVEGQLLGNLQSDIAALRAQLDLAVDNQRQALQTAQSARQLASEARSAADAERKGDAKNSPAGDGRRFREWQRRENEAQSAEAAAREAAQMAHKMQQTLHEQIDTKQSDLLAARQMAEQDILKLQKRLESDPRWQPERGDLLSRVNTLGRLKEDPVEGTATTRIDYLVTSCLLVFELMFLIIKLFFMPPSVYKLRLITATRLEALRVKEDHDEDIAGVLGGVPYAQLHIPTEPRNPPNAGRPGDRPA